MAYLDNTVITVDAVLTKLGRERLSQGGGFFKIDKWAVSDDEVDYSLYNTAHPLGTDYYANIIESMPVLEAIPDETQALRYKLYTADDLSTLPYLKNLNLANSINIATGTGALSDNFDFTPETANFTKGESYVITLFNEDAAILEGAFEQADEEFALRTVSGRSTLTRQLVPRGNGQQTLETDEEFFKRQSSSSRTVGSAKNISGTLVRTTVGSTKVIVRAKDVRSSITTKIRIQGVDTGVTQTISFTVDPRQT
jgi:hypothetical protein